MWGNGGWDGRGLKSENFRRIFSGSADLPKIGGEVVAESLSRRNNSRVSVECAWLPMVP